MPVLVCRLSEVERWRSGQPASRYWSTDALQMNHLQPSPQRNARVRSECRQTALSDTLERAIGPHLVPLSLRLPTNSGSPVAQTTPVRPVHGLLQQPPATARL